MLVNYPIQHSLQFDNNCNATVHLTCQIPITEKDIENVGLNFIVDIANLQQSFTLNPKVSISTVNKEAKVSLILNDFNILQLAPDQFQTYDLTNMSMFQISIIHNSEEEIINIPVYCYPDQNFIKFEIFDP